MMLGYRIKLAPDDNGTLLVTCPALPEVTTFGENREDAIRHAVDAIEEALAARIARGAEVPPPGNVSRNHDFIDLPLLTTLKLQLLAALRDSGLTRADLVRRLGWHREQVDRLFRLDHASRIEQIEAAFRALGRKVTVTVSDAA
jgi:antitoxin HicB